MPWKRKIKRSVFILFSSLTAIASAAQAESEVNESCVNEVTRLHADEIEQATSDYQAQISFCYDRILNETRAETLICIKNAELERRKSIHLANDRLAMGLSDCSKS